MQLGEDRSSTTAELAARVDDLLAATMTTTMPVVAVEEEKTVEAAMESRPNKRKRSQWGQKKRPYNGGNSGNNGNQAAMASWTCLSHTKYGDQARRCHPAYSRAEN